MNVTLAPVMPIGDTLQEESLFVSVNETDRLHIKRLFATTGGSPVLMFHGVVENGRVFCSRSGKGLGPFLAKRGLDVFVCDFRGHGLSEPPLSSRSRYGQTEAITEDIPSLINAVVAIRGTTPQIWVAHSWGGVVLMSYFARFAAHRPLVKAIVLFAAKRCVRVGGLRKLMGMNLGWNGLGRLFTGTFGYLPRGMCGRGTDAESAKFHRQCVEWAKPSLWIDSDDGFDYGAAIQKLELPPILSFAAVGDRYLGHPCDVRDFLDEMGARDATVHVLGKSRGALHDYDHMGILIHPDAVSDHFPEVVNWLTQCHLLAGVAAARADSSNANVWDHTFSKTMRS